MNQVWRRFSCSRQELNLGVVLTCGQSFRWNRSSENPDVWLGVLDKRLWLLKQLDCGDIEYRTLPQPQEECTAVNVENKDLPKTSSEVPPPSTTKVKATVVKNGDIESLSKKPSSEEIKPTPPVVKNGENDLTIISTKDDEQFLKIYFQMDINVSNLYQAWSKNDLFFQELQAPFHGIRILRQDPVENLFSFICSQNNNITRIAQLVEKLCQNYGEWVTEHEGKDYYTFPSISSLAKGNIENDLRQLGFGYRAKFIQRVAETIHAQTNGVEWLFDLRHQSYQDAHSALCSLYGVGPKVADCVCLMSLEKHDAIPVDTHMWQIAAREYLPHLKKLKNVTDKAYKEIGDFFRQQFGEYAGWAQSVLFSSDLKKFESLKAESKKVGKRPRLGETEESKKPKTKKKVKKRK